MKEILDTIKLNRTTIITILFFGFVFLQFQKCSFESKIQKIERKYNDSVQVQIQGIRKEYQLNQIENKKFILEQYKNQLIDFNKLQRSSVRAEDILTEYDKKIHELK